MINYAATHGKHEASLNTHCGRVRTLAGDRLVTRTANGVERYHTLAADVRVTRGGKPCRLDELKPGEFVRVTVGKDDETMAIEIATE
jgi:hypothetical protein